MAEGFLCWPLVAAVGGVRDLQSRFVGAAAWDDKALEKGFRVGEGAALLLCGVAEEAGAMADVPPRVRVPSARIAGVAWWVGVGRMPEERRGDSKGRGES